MYRFYNHKLQKVNFLHWEDLAFIKTCSFPEENRKSHEGLKRLLNKGTMSHSEVQHST